MGWGRCGVSGGWIASFFFIAMLLILGKIFLFDGIPFVCFGCYLVLYSGAESRLGRWCFAVPVLMISGGGRRFEASTGGGYR